MHTKKTLEILLLIVVLSALAIVVLSLRSDTQYQTPENQKPEEHITSSSFDFPTDLDTDYITTSEWPPLIQFVESPYSCLGDKDILDTSNQPEVIRIEDREYCKTSIKEGAAGSVYINYTYSLPHEDSTIVISFSLREPQCQNFEQEEADLCEQEQENFDPDILIDSVVSEVI